MEQEKSWSREELSGAIERLIQTGLRVDDAQSDLTVLGKLTKRELEEPITKAKFDQATKRFEEAKAEADATVESFKEMIKRYGIPGNLQDKLASLVGISTVFAALQYYVGKHKRLCAASQVILVKSLASHNETVRRNAYQILLAISRVSDIEPLALEEMLPLVAHRAAGVRAKVWIIALNSSKHKALPNGFAEGMIQYLRTYQDK